MLYIRSNEAPEIQTIVKRDLKEVAGLPLIDQGLRLFTIYCGSCHGGPTMSYASNYPSLVDLNKRMSRATASEKIKKGSGIMPSFAGVLKEGEQEAILAYIYGIDESAANRAVAISKNELTPAKDLYLNTTGYTTWKDPSGNPAISPPWGTLHALNLSTGE